VFRVTRLEIAEALSPPRVGCRLAAAGGSVRVYERSHQASDGGAAMALRQNGVDVLRRTGAFQGAVDGGRRVADWSIADRWQGTVHKDEVKTDPIQCHGAFFSARCTRGHSSSALKCRRAWRLRPTSTGGSLWGTGESREADLIVGPEVGWSSVRHSLTKQVFACAKRETLLRAGERS
jgi:hypothetical protein